jgi:ubiquinone/menaquinone biosynthesis C-methylase UbiE
MIKIDEKDYYNYIYNNRVIIQSQKDLLIYYFSIKDKFYTNSKTNNQIQLYITNALKNEDMESICRLKLLMYHFIDYKSTEKMMEKIIKNNAMTDYEIVQSMEKSNKKKSKNNKLLHDKWIYAIESISQIATSFFFENNNMINTNYLDIGCGSGKKTMLFSKYLKIHKNNVYGTDIEEWGPYSQNKKHFPFHFKFIKNNILQYPDNFFDIISCTLTLHHVENIELLLSEIFRILKNDGIFILIEHCVNTDNDRFIIDIQHIFYSALYDKKKNFIENPTFIQCFNDYEWNYILDKNNFKCMYKDNIFFGNEYSFTNKYDNIFYTIYKKKF